MTGRDWRHRTWRSGDGLSLHARDYAAAEGEARLPVICIHGLTRNCKDFDALAPWLAARGRRVLAVDVRGRGLSDRDPSASYWLPTYADDVRRLALALGIGRAIFIGTSMGGLITMELSAGSPDLIAAAVINDIGPVLAPAGVARIAAYTGKTPIFAHWAEAEAYLQRQNATMLPRYGAEEWRQMARRMFRETERGVEADYDPAIASAFGTGPIMADPWGRWHDLAEGRPVLLLRGSLSDLLTEEDAEAMLVDHPTVTLRQVPDVGHAPMLDEPEALAALEAFIAELP